MIAIENGIYEIIKGRFYTLQKSPTLEGFVRQTLQTFTEEDIRRFLTWIRAKYVHFKKEWPEQDPDIPCYIVSPIIGNEMKEQVYAGDRIEDSKIIPKSYDSDGNVTAADKIDYFGAPWSMTLQVICWTISSELTPLLHAFIVDLLFRYKGDDLNTFGVRKLGFSDGIFKPNPEYFPTVTYMKTLNLEMEGEWKQEKRTQNIKLRNQTKFLNPTSFN